MATKIMYATILILMLSDLFIFPATARRGNKHNKDQLQFGFYDNTCPRAESIVEEVVSQEIFVNPGIGASLLRLYFHDCFVNGCDASIFLDTTPSGEPTEKTAPANFGVKGFEVIDEAKARLEEECPGTVSCADIMSFAARDAVSALGLSSYRVPAGRRDGLSSLATNAMENLPTPTSSVAQMVEKFNKKGMNEADLVTLLGAHSVGVAHCLMFDKEFHNFNATYDANPRLSPFYAKYMRTICPPQGSASINDVFPLNNIRGDKLSSMFYDNVLQGRAIMPSDQNLLDDPQSNGMVHNYASRPQQWAKDFNKAMVKLGKMEVLIGDHGEIRRSCRAVNKL